jgi:hypothetical protein
MEHQPKQFNIENSPIREAYELLGAKDPLELHKLFSEEDQRLMKSKEWDYENPDLITNKVKNILEFADESSMAEDEIFWRQEILWFWYHHAISTAVYRYIDKELAKEFADKALSLQDEDHPNKITKLLALLVNNKLEEAKEWKKNIPVGDETQTAKELIEEYERGEFFKSRS